MTRALWMIALLALANITAGAQTPRILLVGDSWTQGLWNNRSFQTALQDAGLGAYEEVGAVTAIGGTTAAQWATPGYLDLITQELAAYPAIDIVHLSMGGNDALGSPPADATEAAILYGEMQDNIAVVVAHIHGLRPTAKILWSTYDYPDLPTNYHFDLMTQAVLDLADVTPNLYVLNLWGLMHYEAGYTGVHAPMTTPLPGAYPGYTPILGGDPALPSDPSVRSDAIHLNAAGYGLVAAYAVEQFYAGWLGAVPGGVTIQIGDGSNVSVVAGEALSLTANATGLGGTLAYQWRKDGLDLLGENGATLSRGAAAQDDAGNYSVFVSNGNGAKTLVESPAVTVTVSPAIVIPPGAAIGPAAPVLATAVLLLLGLRRFRAGILR